MGINKDNLKEIVKNSKTYADVLRGIGLKPYGGNYKYIKKQLKELNIDVSHFTGKATNIGNRLNKNKEKNVDEYLVLGSDVKSNVLKWKLFSNGIKKYKCEKCGCTHWNGKQINLQLHHINGDNTDNRIENLQILCPNCHSQTDNFCGANKKNDTEKKCYCKHCGKEITKTKSGLCNKCYDELINSDNGIKIVHSEYKYIGTCEICGGEVKDKRNKLCDKCAREQKRKAKRPNKEELYNLVKNNTFTKLAEKFGVSRTTISKWCKYYGLPFKKKDIKKI